MTSEVHSEVPTEVHSEAPTFEGVARLVAEKERDVEWLADGIRGWIWPQEKWPRGTREFGSGLAMFADMGRVRWSRARLLKALKETLPSAANTLTDMLADWPLMRFLTVEPLGPGFGPLDQVALVKLLHEIRRRCREASRFSEIVTADGKPKAGRNRALAPGQIDEKVACASTVAVAWKFARGTLPGPHVKQAARAADLLFPLGMALAGRFDLVVRRRVWSEDPLSAWPPHFKAAFAPNPVLDRLNEMFVKELEFARERHAAGIGSQTPRVAFIASRYGTKSGHFRTGFRRVLRCDYVFAVIDTACRASDFGVRLCASRIGEVHEPSLREDRRLQATLRQSSARPSRELSRRRQRQQT
jgi:hypothetical protein